MRECGMDRRVIIASCEAEAGRNRDDLALRSALEKLGAGVETLAWNAPGFEESSAELCVIRSAWDYPADVQGFKAWGEGQSARRILVNPFSLVSWNLLKDYLLELDLRGVPVVPTRLLEAEANLGEALEAAAAAFGTRRLVVKPSIGNSGQGVCLLDLDAGAGEADAGSKTTRSLIQPFAESVRRDGEIALVWIDGEVTHAMRKRPAQGKFLVHEERGGSLEPLAVEAQHGALAEQVIAALPLRPLYARIDCIEYRGTLLVSEVELIEPELYLDRSDVGCRRMAAALVERIC